MTPKAKRKKRKERSIFMEKKLYDNELSGNHLVEAGSYYNISYIIASCGTHPVAYVKIPKGHYFYQIKNKEILYDYPMPCHGGITFAGTPYTQDYQFNEDDLWIGWDYAHCGDFYREGSGKKWTKEEIKNEIKTVIEFLLSEKKSNEIIIKSISPDGSISYWVKNWNKDEIKLKESLETILENLGFVEEK